MTRNSLRIDKQKIIFQRFEGKVFNLIDFFVVLAFTFYIFRYILDRILFDFPPILLSNFFWLPLFILIGSLYTAPRISISKVSIIVILIFTLLTVYYGMTVLWSPQTPYSIRKSYLTSIVLPVLVLFTMLVIAKSEYRVITFYLLTLCFSLITSVVLLHEYVVYGAIVSDKFANYYITTNRALGLGAVISVFFGLRYKNLRLRIFTVVILLLNLYLMTRTGGRGPLVATIVAISVYSIWIVTLRQNKAANIFKDILALLSGGIVLSLSFLALFNGGRTIQRLTMLVSDPGDSVMRRIDMAISSIGFFMEKPIFGHGVGAFKSLYVAPFQYPHNIFLELLVESGIIGLILLITYLLCVIVIIVRYGRENSVNSGIVLSLFTFFLLNACVSGDLPSNYELFIYSTISLAIVKNDWN